MSVSAFPDRLEEIIRDRGESASAFSRSTGIPYSTLRTYLTGRSQPSIDNLAKIARTANVDLVWLITGESGTYEHLKTGSTPQVEVDSRVENLLALITLQQTMISELHQLLIVQSLR